LTHPVYYSPVVASQVGVLDDAHFTPYDTERTYVGCSAAISMYVTTRSVVDYTSVNELKSTMHRVVTYLFHDR